MSTTPAGWYPDPEREGATRWWDGAQWAPSQEPTSSDDRFRPRDEATTDAESQDAASADGSWAPLPQQDETAASAQPDWQQPGSAPSWGQADASASAPAWGQGQAPSWQQSGQTPSYGQPDASQGSWSQPATQDWNQYGGQPRKSRTGLIVGIVAGVLVLLLLLLVGGFFLLRGVLGAANPPVSQGEGLEGPGSFQVSVPADGQAVEQLEITTAGTYQIDVESLNGEDPRIELSGNGQSWSDDDGGDGLDSQLLVDLDAGTYTLVVEEYGGDPLQAQVTVAQR